MNAPAPSPKRKTFVIGAGCQKGGTTWLYHYLKSSPEFAHGYRKEYHVFDSLDLPSEAWMRDRILGQAERALEAARNGEPADGHVLHRASMYANPELYYDYFSMLLRRAPRFRAAADLTPDYAMLSAERFAQVQAGFAARGVRTASVFLMRDPVDRTWSQIRMQDDRQPTRFSAPTQVVLEEQHAEPVYERRSRYQDTIAALDQVFAPEDVHYGFYEELFDEAQLRAVTGLLGMQFQEPDTTTRRNSSTRPQEQLPDHVARKVATHYADVYEAVARRFPDKDLRTLWPYSRYVLG